MTNLVIMKDRQAVTSSLQVAEGFEKQHKHVIEAIETKIQSVENSAHYKSMFVEGEYIDSRGRQQKVYFMNRDGFAFIAMGFTGRKADEFKLKYINAFNQMENEIKTSKLPTDPMEILALTFEAQKQEKEKLKLVDSRVTDLEENVSIAPGDYSYLTRRINKTVYRHLAFRGYHKTKEQVSLFYEDINQGIHKISGVKTRSRLKQKHFNSVDSFISEW